MVIIDANKFTDNFELKTDICIVGAGAAGIAIARELDGSSPRICLLESGGFSINEETQSLYNLESIGHTLRQDIMRIRYFGGTTNTWTGRCLKLNEIDFEQREWVPESGWPISLQDLDPYYQRAATLFNLPSFSKIEAEFWHQKSLYKDEKLVFSNQELTPVVSLRARTPVRFGSTYLKQLRSSKNINICINGNVTEIEASNNLSKVERLHASCLKGTKFSIKAKIFILACGGLENPRLLLLSRRQNSAGLGNQFDVVGRYYMDHPNIEHGFVLPYKENFNAPLLLGNRTFDGTTQFGIAFSREVQRREKLLNHYILLRPKFSEKLAKVPRSTRLLHKSMYLYRKILKKPLKFESLIVRNYLEQQPNSASQVTLSNQRDKFGLNLLKVDWRISSEERNSLHQFHKILGKYLEVHKIGRLKNMFPEDESLQPEFLDGFHHIGATRMSDNPRKGVVNRDCQVHGTQNLFIAGCSVFPTGGHANPTLTLVALAIQLADHIKQLNITGI